MNEKDGKLRTAEDFANALTEIARRAIESDDFREHAIKDPEWAVAQVTDGRSLEDGVELVIRDCLSGEDWSGPWPGEYPEPATYRLHLPTSMKPAFQAHLMPPPRCTCPPITDYSC